jgi:hypothetical protein
MKSLSEQGGALQEVEIPSCFSLNNRDPDSLQGGIRSKQTRTLIDMGKGCSTVSLFVSCLQLHIKIGCSASVQ